MMADREDLAFREAARWTARATAGRMSSAEQTELARWLHRDPLNAAALDAAMAGWRELGSIPFLAMEGVERRRPLKLPIWSGVAALSAAGAAAAFLMMPQLVTLAPPHPVTAETAVDRVLSDGSRIHVQPRTVLHVAFSEKQRLILMTQGAARFSVAKAPDRPFMVQAPGFFVQAVGTRFDVSVGPTVIDVRLLEGKLRVVGGSQVKLISAGDSVRFDRRSAKLDVVRNVAVADLTSTAGTSSRLPQLPSRSTAAPSPDFAVSNQSLATVAGRLEEISGLRISFADEAAANVKVSGQFSRDNPVAGLKKAVAGHGLTITTSGNQLTVGHKDSSSTVSADNETSF